MSGEFIGIEIIRDENGQQLKLVREDGTKEVYSLKAFPYKNGGPVITGEYDIKFKRDE
ncbi:MAG: hypothetical protein ACKUBY_04305 [Candidatus Moraniibacteriota bacterium]